MLFYRCEILELILIYLYQLFMMVFVRGKLKMVSEMSSLYIIQVINMLREGRVNFACCEIGYCVLDKNFEHLTYK